MKKQVAIVIMLLLLIMQIEIFSKNYANAQTRELITIHPNGTIECLDPNQIDNIQQNNNIYTFKTNIIGEFLILKENIVLDGAYYTLNGLIQINASQVTIKNIKIINPEGAGIINYFSECEITNTEIHSERGIKLRNSHHNIISRNIINASSSYGVEVGHSTYNSFIENNITSQRIDGMHLTTSDYNTFSRNNITFIHLYKSSYNNLDENNCVEGIKIRRSSNYNNITRNKIVNYNSYPDNTIDGSGDIQLEDGIGNIISSNILTNSGGIIIGDSSNNVLRNNIIDTYRQGFIGLESHPNPSLSSGINDIDSSNIINGKPIYYFVGKTDLEITPSNYLNPAYLVLVNCSRVIIKDLTFDVQGILLGWTNDVIVTDNNIVGCNSGILLYHASNVHIINNNISSTLGVGVKFYKSNQNIFSGNFIEKNNLGLRFISSDVNNTITNNNISDNTLAMHFDFSSNNNFYNNNFINNSELIYDYYYDMKDSPFYYSAPSVGVWDEGSQGNYWSSYTGQNPLANPISGSGIWDTPFIIDENNTDRYPLISRVVISSVPIPELPKPTVTPIPTANPTSSPTSSPSTDPTPTPEPEPFPTTLAVASIALIVVITSVILVFFKKIKK